MVIIVVVVTVFITVVFVGDGVFITVDVDVVVVFVIFHNVATTLFAMWLLLILLAVVYLSINGIIS